MKNVVNRVGGIDFLSTGFACFEVDVFPFERAAVDMDYALFTSTVDFVQSEGKGGDIVLSPATLRDVVFVVSLSL